MKYGKIYHYDRLGNRVNDAEPVIKNEVRHFSVNSPNLARPHVNVPFDENRIFPDLPRSPSMEGLNTQELISFDKPALPAELDDIRFPQDTPEEFRRPKPMFSPLNDLKDPSDERQQFAQQLDQLTEKLGQMRSANELAEQFHEADIAKEMASDDLCEDCIRSLTRHGQRPHVHGHGQQHASADDEDEWKRRIRDHVDNVNANFFHEKRRRELLPMNVLPPFAYRPEDDKELQRKQKEAYRIELENDIEQRERKKVHDYESGQRISNVLNTADAQAYANDKMRLKQLQEANERYDTDFNRRQAAIRNKQQLLEDNQGEWWEGRQKMGEVKFERDSQHFHDQMRRNRFLQQNLNNLQDYEERFKDLKEQQWAMRYPHQADVKAKIEIQSELTRPEAARRARENLESVWDQWAEAHRRNDRRKTVLQEFDRRVHVPQAVVEGRGAVGGHMGQINGGVDRTAGPSTAYAEHIKSCRRCHRPMQRRVVFAS